jgi:hypothetical protein
MKLNNWLAWDDYQIQSEIVVIFIVIYGAHMNIISIV